MEMDMIFTDMTTQDRDVPSLTGLAHQFPCPQCYLTFQHMASILRNPYKMVLNLIDCMCNFAVFLARGSRPMSHPITTHNLLKLFA
jgi:hypothetical protein